MNGTCTIAMIFFTLLVTISIPGCTQARSHSIEGCPILLAYIDDTDDVYSLDVYVADTGIRRKVALYQFKGFPSLISYDTKSDCWFVEEDEITKKSVIKICGNKATPVKPESAASLSGTRFKSSVANGKLVVSLPDAEGKRTLKRELIVPDGSIVECASITWSPENDYIAAELLLVNTSESQLYLFDRDLQIVNKLGRGSGPQFVASGKKLIYQDISWAMSSDDESTPSGHGTGNAVVYDTSTHVKRMINIVYSPDKKLDGIANCIGSSDGNWLVCSYAKYPEPKRVVYIVDIRNEDIKWHKLPFGVYDGQWMLLDKMPTRFLR